MGDEFNGGGGMGGEFRGRGRGGFRGRGRGRGGRRGGPPEGPIDELKLYVGSLSWGVDDAGLLEAFTPYGNCEVWHGAPWMMSIPRAALACHTLREPDARRECASCRSAGLPLPFLASSRGPSIHARPLQLARDSRGEKHPAPAAQ